MRAEIIILLVGGVCASNIYRPPSTSIRFALEAALEARAISLDNTCGSTGVGGSNNSYTCPSTLPCCSVNGYCGSTNEYCLTTVGCQAAFGNCTAPSNGTISPDMTCGLVGAGNQGYSCPSTASCCSAAGWCGSTSDYCLASSGCQPTYGTCNGTATTPSTGTSGTSTTGQCGPGFGSCASNECCSFAGYCGTTEAYCTAPDCQTAYGPACDANKSPSGVNTSSIARPLLGSITYGAAGIYDCAEDAVIAITYDDGPYIYTDHILDLLQQYNASATFFITGINNGKGEIDDPSLPWPATIRRMYAEGHQVASHTWSHADLCNITSSERKNEMYKNEMALRNILGVIPTYMRPPYSSCTAECGCEADMLDLGYHISYFDLDTADYLNDSPTLIQNSKDIFSAALNAQTAVVEDSDFLVIAHDIHNQTANNLTEYMLVELLNKGYRPVTLGECLGDAKENWYRTDTSVSLGS